MDSDNTYFYHFIIYVLYDFPWPLLQETQMKLSHIPKKSPGQKSQAFLRSPILKHWIIELRKQMFNLGFNIDTTENQLLFPNTQNRLLSLTKLNKWLQVVIDTYNKNHKDKLKRINVHGIRHTACSLMLESGSSIKAVQLQLGHSDTSQIMKVYWHVSQKAQLDTVNKLADFIAK